MFADDTTLYITHYKRNYIEWCIQEDLKILQDWFKANKLTLNLTKTVCMTFGKKNKNLPVKITMGNEIIKTVEKTKFLGVWLDSNLTWQNHYDHLLLKLAKGKYMLQCCKNIFNMFTKKTIYFAHIYSHLVYGTTTWGNMLTTSKI